MAWENLGSETEKIQVDCTGEVEGSYVGDANVQCLLKERADKIARRNRCRERALS